MSIKILKSVRWSISYILVVPFIVCVVVAWTAYARITEFESFHHKIAKSTVSTVANEISQLINNQQRLLNLFVKREEQLVHRVALSPDAESLNAELAQKISDFFPDYFAFTIADHDGNPFIDDFDGHVGDLCVNDIKEHAKGKPHLLRLHPNNYFYHIDFMVPWGIKLGDIKKERIKSADKKSIGGIFFVSFKPNFIARMLKLSSPPRHKLQLINTHTKNLIEITENGSRIKLDRNDFRLTEEEQQRALYSVPVKNTFWKLTDSRESTLFSEYRNDIIKISLIIVLIFIGSSVIMIILLLRAERRRLSAEQTKEEMFSLFNHDLRSPLVAIYGFLDLILVTSIAETKPQVFKKLAVSAFNNAEVMKEIVDDILDVQKMEAGEMSFEFDNIELISLVRKAVDMNIQHGKMNHVSLDMESEVSEIFIKADSRRLIQALTNLLSNAIKYSPEHEIVRIAVAALHDGIEVTVSDKGPGIDKDFQPLVFDKFAQSKSKLTRQVGGTGLGLAIVKYIVDAHNGYVSFETEIDKGTTFKICLPY